MIEAEHRVIEVISKALKTQVKRDTKMRDVATWDSLGHLSVLVALDTEFDNKIGGIKEIASADSVQRILDILKKEQVI